MTGEEMERAIESLINHHAKVSSDIEELKEAQKISTANIAALGLQAEVDRRDMREMFSSLTEEMREDFDKLILSNEVTRDLSNQVARLAIETSKRVSVLEDKLK